MIRAIGTSVSPKVPMSVLLLGALVALPAGAATPKCRGVDTALTASLKSEYAALVAKAVEGKVKPAQVKLMYVLRAGDWGAAYASTPVADDGMFFFQTVNGHQQFKDVWGGWAEASEKPELIDWAKKLGAPDALAECFAKLMTTHEG